MLTRVAINCLLGRRRYHSGLSMQVLERVRMLIGRRKRCPLRDELAFVSSELECLESELDGWVRMDLSQSPDRERSAWRRERLGHAVKTYSARKDALSAAIRARAE